MGLFSLGRRRDTASGDASRKIAAEVRDVLALGTDDAVTVSQIDCGDPACPGGAETIILVMRKGQPTRAAKIRKALRFVADGDVAEALAAM
jgi:hypothetical protein